MRWIIGAVIAGVCLAGCAGTAERDSAAGGSHASAPTSDASATPSEQPADRYVAPEPDGTYTESCDYLLGDFSESAAGYRFVADARLNNTGNVGTVTRVTARWFLAGGDEISDQKTVRMKPGSVRRVGFVHVASADQIDLHQALGYSAKTCVVKATIVDTFGEPESP